MSVKTHDFVQNGANQNGRHRDASLFRVSKQNYWKLRAESKNFKLVVVVFFIFRRSLESNSSNDAGEPDIFVTPMAIEYCLPIPTVWK